MSSRQQLRPLSVGETLDAVFKIYTSNFVTLITIAAVVLVPILLISGVLQIAFVNDMVNDLETLQPGEVPSLGDFFDGAAVAGNLILALFSWAASALASGAMVKVVADTYLGRETSWQESIRFALSRLGPLMIGSFLFALGVGVGFIFLIIPGIILAVSWAVFAPAIVVENKSATEGLGRSWQLMSGRRWPVFGTFLIFYILLAIVGAILGLILSGLLLAGTDGAFNFGNVILSMITEVLTAPLLAVTTTVIYFDLRVRKEAFDVTLLANSVGEAPPTLQTPSSDLPPPPPQPPTRPDDSDGPPSAWPPPSDT